MWVRPAGGVRVVAVVVQVVVDPDELADAGLGVEPLVEGPPLPPGHPLPPVACLLLGSRDSIDGVVDHWPVAAGEGVHFLRLRDGRHRGAGWPRALVVLQLVPSPGLGAASRSLLGAGVKGTSRASPERKGYPSLTERGVGYRPRAWPTPTTGYRSSQQGLG